MSGQATLSFERTVDVRHEVDVFVAGGGPAGVAAAVAAARAGARVMVVEGTNCFGGMGTAGLLNAFMHFGDDHNFLAGGVGRDVFDLMIERDAHGPDDDMDPSRKSAVMIKTEKLKVIYDDLVTESGADYVFHTQVVGVQCDGARVTHAVCSAKSGLFAVAAKVFVDCTGDGDVAALAGARFEKGDAEGRMMPGTLCSLWINIDWEEAERAGHRHGQSDHLSKAFGTGLFTVEDTHMPGLWRTGGTYGSGNIGHTFGVDGTDERSLTEATVRARKHLREYERFFKEYLQGYEEMELVGTGSLHGIRETRRITGDYVMCLDDFTSKAVFEDEIGRYNYPVDIHASSVDKKDTETFEKEFRTYRYGPGETYGVPYRSLTPVGLDNVYVAGRCVSSDRYMQGSIRVMPGCFITGQAAGVGAALAAGGSGATREVDVKALQSRLKSMGTYLPNCP